MSTQLSLYSPINVDVGHPVDWMTGSLEVRGNTGGGVGGWSGKREIGLQGETMTSSP